MSKRLSTEAGGGRLLGKVALITGAASGLGKATAMEFIYHGAKVVVADIQHQPGQETAAELGPNASFISCDVTREADISAAVDFAVTKHGHFDIIYNNAGIASATTTIANLDLTEFDRVMSINVRGVIAGIKHAARVMIPRRTGCILCTASVGGMMGGLAPHAYSISKFAVVGTVKSMASELCRHGIRVNCISPAAIPTPIIMDPMGKNYPATDTDRLTDIVHEWGELAGTNCEPQDVAKAAVYLASDDAKYVSGHNLVVDGGFTSFKRIGFPPP